MSEFSRRVDIEVFKEDPLSEADWYEAQDGVDTDGNFFKDDAALRAAYADYLASFQPYWWHAQSPNGEILTNGEHYVHEDGAINSIEALFGDDTTMYWAREYGEDRGLKLLRYGKTDRDAQGDDSPER